MDSTAQVLLTLIQSLRPANGHASSRSIFRTAYRKDSTYVANISWPRCRQEVALFPVTTLESARWIFLVRSDLIKYVEELRMAWVDPSIIQPLHISAEISMVEDYCTRRKRD